MLILELLSKPAISFLSFPIILQVKRDMEKKNSQENFIDKYKGNREDLDKFDGQVFRYTCLFYSGLLASVVFGIHAYLITGRLMSLGLFAPSLLSILILCLSSFMKIKRTIQMAPVMLE